MIVVHERLQKAHEELLCSNMYNPQDIASAIKVLKCKAGTHEIVNTAIHS